MISTIAKEKAAQIEKMAEADLNVSKRRNGVLSNGSNLMVQNIAQTVLKSQLGRMCRNPDVRQLLLHSAENISSEDVLVKMLKVKPLF